MRRDHVIKHRAPNGALRQVLLDAVEVILLQDVIKHRAPNGALRQILLGPLGVRMVKRHKAPSAKRCIKTLR